jgi:hypothetical protein
MGMPASERRRSALAPSSTFAGVAAPSIVVEVDCAVSPAGWDDEIRAFGGSLFHTHAWSEYRARNSAQALFFRWRDENTGDVIALALGAQHPMRTGRFPRLVSYVLIESPPATSRLASDLLTPLRRWAMTASRSVTEVQLGCLDPRSRWAPADPPRPLRHYEFLFPPRIPTDVLGAMSRGTRSHIRRAARLGLDVRRSDSWQDLVAFAHLGEQTKKRLMATKGLPPSGESPEMRAAALQTLVSRGAGRLYVASLGGRPLAGCFFGIWDGSAYYLQNGADLQAQRYDAVHFALHGAITDFMADGFTRVNLGAVPADGRDEASINHGLYNFKLRLGTQPIPCVGGSLAIRPARARALSVARDQRHLLRAIRRHLSLTPASTERSTTIANSPPGGQ